MYLLSSKIFFHKSIKPVFLLLITVVFAGCTSSQYYNLKETRKHIKASIQDSLISHANWGIIFESLDNDEIFFEYNADKMFIPASNQKIVTSAAALKTLGHNFRYKTKLFYSGEIIDSVLIGDLIIQGFGDPTFSLEFFSDPRQPFYLWADTLSSLGITRITGDIIGNDDAFDDNGLGNGWMLEDLDNSYAVETGALQFNNNLLKLKIIPPTKTHKAVRIIPGIASNYYSILDNTTSLVNDSTKLKVERIFGKNEIIISGNLTADNHTRSRSVSVSNPTKYYVNILKEVFAEQGIQIEGKSLDCDEIENWNFQENEVEFLTWFKSPPLSEILTVLMKDSINMYAETLVKTMGLNNCEIGSFKEGKKVVEKFLLDFDIQPDSYSYQDGSGLSRYNLISPRQLSKILKGMRSSENWLIWKDMFPIAGVDGTMKNRFSESMTDRLIIAKTGTMSNVRCLSGYIFTSQNDFAFSILVNGHLLESTEIDLITDNILKLVIENFMK